MREGVWGGSQRPAAGGEELGEGDGTNLEALTMRSCEKNKGGALTGFFRWKKVRGTVVRNLSAWPQLLSLLRPCGLISVGLPLLSFFE